MYNIEPGQHPRMLYLTAIISIINISIGQLTKSDVAWGIGIVVGIITIINGIYTWREKVLSIRKLKKELGINKSIKTIFNKHRK